jgi:hypothetical protein
MAWGRDTSVSTTPVSVVNGRSNLLKGCVINRLYPSGVDGTQYLFHKNSIL